MEQAGKSLVVVGAGGNIGSHLVGHLARLSELAPITLIDRDVYEERNLRSQDIAASDVPKSKAAVQAKRLRRICPSLEVVPIPDDVRDVPLGLLRADAILACLDTRTARLGVPWVDAGVAPDGLLARVNVYVPATDAPCLECAWDDRDYQALEQAYPCANAEAGEAPTDAPSSVGALAASLQAIECRKLLMGQKELAAIGRQALLDAERHKHYLTEFRRNPRCRFDHAVCQIEKLDSMAGVATVGGMLRRIRGAK